MLSLRFANRFETLRDALVANLAADAGPVFEAPQIVVPSSGMRRALTLAVADRLGICANVGFAYLAAWLWRQIARVVESVEGESPFAARVLAWQIYELLNDPTWPPAFPRLARYLEDADPLRRWDLATEIAVVMEQYITYRQDWLTAWSRGERIDAGSAGESAAADQDWQADLWRRLLGRVGSGREHPAHRFFGALQASASADARSEPLPASAHVFCLPDIPPLYLDVLVGLGQWIDVQVYVLNPCREYWFDIVDAKRLSHLVIRGAAAHRETGNRLLAAWGKQTQGQIELLLDRSGNAPVDDNGYVDDFPDTMLGGVQRSIFQLTDVAPGSLGAARDDRSIEVHVCHSLTRELEVLQDQLLALLSGPAPPAVADILVVTPNLETAAPLIDAVFGNVPAERQVPYRISGRGRSTVNAAARALLSVLAILPSRFPASALLELLQQPIVGRRFGIGGDAMANIERWIQESGIRWGIDAEHRRDQGLPAEARFSVEDGLHRLFLGYALPDRVAAPSLDRVPAGQAEGSRASDLGVFAWFLDCLKALRDDFRRPRSADEWLTSLTAALGTFLAPIGNEVDDLGEVQDAIRTLHADMVRGGLREVPLAVVRSALETVLDESVHGGVPGGAVTFTSMTSLRNLPFAVICAIGIDDGAFPRNIRPVEFDLMTTSPRLGDRQRRSDDRNLFLDLLLAARRRFYVSYTGRSVRDNAVLPASVVVAELIDALVPAIAEQPGDPASLEQARRRLVVEHPLQAFSRLYFSAGGDPRIRSFNRELRDALAGAPALAAAGVRADGRDDGEAAAAAGGLADAETLAGEEDGSGSGAVEAVPFFPAPLAPAGEEWRSVSLDQLLRFFNNPCRFLLQDRLGIALFREESSQSDDEPFVPDRAARDALAARLLPQAMQGLDESRLDSLAQAGIEFPPGALGTMLLHEEMATMRHFAGTVRQATQPECLEPVSFDQSFDLEGEAWRFSTVLTGVRPEGWVLYRYGATGPKDYLRGWLSHLVLCAAQPGRELRTRWISRDGEFVLEPCGEAPSILRGLLRLYRSGLREPLHFFPYSAWALLLAGLDKPEGWKKARETWRPWYDGVRGEREDRAYALAFRGRADPIDEDFGRCVTAVYGSLRTHLRDERLKAAP